jgi:hypothetical protein
MAIEPWLPLDAKRLAVLTLFAMGALAIGSFMH